jgi:hypothetical protein
MEMKQEKGIHLLSETKISHQMTQGIGTVQLLRAVPTVINMHELQTENITVETIPVQR